MKFCSSCCALPPVEDEREAGADLQRDGQQQHRQGERHAVELHVGERAGEPGHLGQTGDQEVQAEERPACDVHRTAEGVEERGERVVHG
jgi:hypothetical protein